MFCGASQRLTTFRVHPSKLSYVRCFEKPAKDWLHRVHSSTLDSHTAHQFESPGNASILSRLSNHHALTPVLVAGGCIGVAIGLLRIPPLS